MLAWLADPGGAYGAYGAPQPGITNRCMVITRRAEVVSTQDRFASPRHTYPPRLGNRRPAAPPCDH